MTDRHKNQHMPARMLRRLNIDIRHSFDLNMPFIARAAGVCAHCPHTGQCRDWMNAGVGNDGYPAFCPNAACFDCLPRNAVDCDPDRYGRLGRAA